MHFNKHSELKDRHAFLSPSNYHWINYSDEKLFDRMGRWEYAIRGTKLHDLARRLIEMQIKQARNGTTFNQYVNDGIGFHMEPEVPLFYSRNCFGTADSISYYQGILRVSDLKTGISKVSFQQLMIYAALFCLEYGIRPFDIARFELRIYQNDRIELYKPDGDEIAHVMDRIVYLDRLIEERRTEDNYELHG
jgi:hypothetical protein